MWELFFLFWTETQDEECYLKEVYLIEHFTPPYIICSNQLRLLSTKN